MNPLIGLIVLALTLVFIVSSGIQIYNRLIMVNQNVDKTFANIDVLLKQRADELPELVKVVRKYMEYEDGVLTKITTLRTKLSNTADKDEKVKAFNELTSAFDNIMAVSENYPELKASDFFNALLQKVSEMKDHISDGRGQPILYGEQCFFYLSGLQWLH